VREHYRLPDRYLFYPANFWPHKNHVRIVQAIGTLKAEAGLEVHVAFTGTSGDELARATAADVSRSAQELGIGDAVHELGYVEDSDMSALYAEAEGLVMPTFFGPTNIPVLEAWAFGCPVLTSDIRGIREQVGDAGVLVRPDSVASIAEGIHRLWSDENLRRELAERGRMRLASYQPEDYRGRLEDIVDDARGRIGGAP
jgi:glycosyltransferase involved in cell wall biosynthesis